MATTRPQSGAVTAFIDGIQDEDRREDCRLLLGVMKGTTGEERQVLLRPARAAGPGQDRQSCIYVKRRDDLDREILVELIERAVAHIDQVYDAAGGVMRMSEMPAAPGLSRR